VPSANVDLIRRGYEAWNQGDLDWVEKFVDSEIEWRGYTHIPESGTLRGRDEVRAWLERFRDAWEQLDIEVDDLIDTGDQVLALVRFSGTGRGSGVPVEGGADAHVWTIHDGRIVAVSLYQGTSEALESLGLAG
jgi:ketosteroid isomerase-like protein